MCPNCRKESFCGCNSCRKRKGLSPIRSQKFQSNDTVKCPYCKSKFNVWVWEDFNMDEYYKQKIKEL